MESLLVMALLSSWPNGTGASLRSAAELNSACTYQTGNCVRGGEWTDGMGRDAAFEFVGRSLFPEGGLSLSLDHTGAARVVFRRDF